MPENADALLKMFLEYAEVCNRFDMVTAMKYFAEDPWIEAEGFRSQGTEAVRKVHECDEGCRALVFFNSFVWEGDVLTCNFIYETELDRVLGLPGLSRRSQITFKNGLIEGWLVEKADPADMEQRRPMIAPVMAWAKEHRPDLLERGRSGITYEAGHAYTELAEAWKNRVQ